MTAHSPHASLITGSYAHAIAESADGQVRPISAWVVTSDEFNGIVYTREIALSKVAAEPRAVIEHITLYRPVTRRDDT